MPLLRFSVHFRVKKFDAVACQDNCHINLLWRASFFTEKINWSLKNFIHSFSASWYVHSEWDLTAMMENWEKIGGYFNFFSHVGLVCLVIRGGQFCVCAAFPKKRKKGFCIQSNLRFWSLIFLLKPAFKRMPTRWTENRKLPSILKCNGLSQISWLDFDKMHIVVHIVHRGIFFSIIKRSYFFFPIELPWENESVAL